MPVGAGSIKRAAKLNAGAEKVEKAKTSVKEEVKTSVKKSAVSTKEQMTQELGSNQVCRLTEELPIYLL